MKTDTPRVSLREACEQAEAMLREGGTFPIKGATWKLLYQALQEAPSERRDSAELEKKIAAFSMLREGWDSYGAKAFTKRTIALAMELAKKLGDEWKAVPCSDGSIELYRGNEDDVIFLSTPDAE